MIGRVRITLGMAVAVVVLTAAAPAWAKGDIPFRVVTPSGKMFWVRGAAAKVWWHDWARARSCMCVTPSDSARWARRVAGAWGGDPPTPYVLEPRIGLVTLIYPAAGRAPAYGLTPNALGSNARAWNMWFFPTKQMQRILASGSTTAANIAAAPAPAATQTGSVTWVWSGIAGAVALCMAVIALPPTRRLVGRAITARH